MISYEIIRKSPVKQVVVCESFPLHMETCDVWLRIRTPEVSSEVLRCWRQEKLSDERFEDNSGAIYDTSFWSYHRQPVTCNSRAAKAVDDDVMGEKMKSKALLLHLCCVMKIVLVEIERRPPDTWGAESAESTLWSRRIDHHDFFLDSADRSDGLARLGDELELYTTRPGVRRRIFITPTPTAFASSRSRRTNET